MQVFFMRTRYKLLLDGSQAKHSPFQPSPNNKVFQRSAKMLNSTVQRIIYCDNEITLCTQICVVIDLLAWERSFKCTFWKKSCVVFL